MWSTLPGLLGTLLPIIVGCASGSGRSECPEIRQPSAAQPSAAPSAAAPLAMAAPVASLPQSVAPAASDAAPASALPSLPELKLQLVGMHIGGGPNDDSSKRPFIQAIEGSFEAMRICYKKSDDPTRGGTFGVDLKIAHNGGKAELQQVRTAMKGEGLRECLEGAFRGINFGPPPKGPTVVSVSVKFTLGT